MSKRGKHRVWESPTQFIPSKHRKMKDTDVLEQRMLAEIIRRPHLWPMPLIMMHRVSGDQLTEEDGCIFFPYDLLATASRCSVAVILAEDDTVPPSGSILDCKLSAITVEVLSRHFLDARKIYYRTPEAMVADGWMV